MGVRLLNTLGGGGPPVRSHGTPADTPARVAGGSPDGRDDVSGETAPRAADQFVPRGALVPPPVRGPLADVRRTQATGFLARVDALRRGLPDGAVRLGLGAFAQELAARFAAPQAPVGLTALDRFLDQATHLAGVDIELLKEFLLLLRHFAEKEGPLAEFLLQVEQTLADFSGGGLAGANAFLADTAQTAGGVSLSARVAQFLVDVHANSAQVSVSISIQITSVSVEITTAPAEGDPLVLDLDGDGIELTGIADGRRFDLDGDGRPDQTAFVTGNDGALALDRNGNGLIDDGRELFGDQHGAANGFAELATFDRNGDGAIDPRDAVFADLRVLGDFDGDGIVAPSEVRTLADLDIVGILLETEEVDETAAGDNRLVQRGTFIRSDGTTGLAADVLLRYRPG